MTVTTTGPEYGIKYTLEGPDGTKAVFNDSTDPNFVGSLSPESSGLDSADVRESAIDNVEGDGGIHGNFYYGRRPVVLQGTIIASSAAQRNERALKIQTAANALRADASLRWKTQGGTVEEVELKVRRQQPVRITKGYVKEFQIPLVSANPVILSYGVIETGVVGAIVTKESAEWRDEAGSGGSKVWGTPSAAAKSDNTYATAVLGTSGESGKSHWLISKAMGFAIPEKATILDWSAKVERHASETGSNFKSTFKHTSKTGAITGAGFTALETIGKSDTALENMGHGGADGLSPSIVNNVAFGAGIFVENTSGGERTYSLDQMAISIEYIESTIEVENVGNATTFPILRLTGPVTGPVKLENIDGVNNDFITINLSLSKSETLEVDLFNRTITVNGINKYSSLIFSESTWWGIIPGINKVKFSTNGANSETKFIIEYQNGWV